MDGYEQYSVLMSVYHKEKPEYERLNNKIEELQGALSGYGDLLGRNEMK